ncbi:MAG: peptidase M14 [Gemmatimonadetes bacterium]|nr:peptidase M14 [Gemmatimonadota bacterium]HPF61561.1 M14 family metallopeptidase [Gemmatimonadales bacterium]HRX19199.1 M14 family metallopeptidase [Gemmatimonadales bacterium]
MRTLRLLLPTLCLATATAAGQQALGNLAAAGSPRAPKVQVSWDRFYDHAAIGEIGRRLQAAHPNTCRLSSIGKSHEGRDLWLITVTNFDVGEADRKPAMYIDGNIHSNEIQGTEFSLYTAWYLCEMRGQNAWIDSLLATRTLYIVPTINPDGREDYLKEPNTASSPRTGRAPRDNDGDGVIDEDTYDDLDGDGNITQMRRRTPYGRFIQSPEEPRLLVPAPPGTAGEWELLGSEGIDNDGDGLVNEDGVGGYDPNRNWPWRWQPQYVQGGADWYPTSLPETQAVVDFVTAHPNIAGAQSYHNNGGMILRGPGSPQDEYRPQDVRVYDELGRVGERILPGYRYMVVWKDLYIVWGGELDWFYGGRGIVTFSNELWTSFKQFETTERNDNRYDRQDYEFDRLLLFKDAFVEWKPFTHPQYGEIEVGGFKKTFGRAEPGFLLQAEAHRNMAFTLYQTWQLPMVEVDSVATRALGNGLTEVTAIVVNRRLVPTHTQQDVENRISPPDIIALTGGDAIAGYRIVNDRTGESVEQEREPARLRIENIAGRDLVRVKWIVRGGGPYTVTVTSTKGGSHSRTTSGR